MHKADLFSSPLAFFSFFLVLVRTPESRRAARPCFVLLCFLSNGLICVLMATNITSAGLKSNLCDSSFLFFTHGLSSWLLDYILQLSYQRFCSPLLLPFLNAFSPFTLVASFSIFYWPHFLLKSFRLSSEGGDCLEKRVVIKLLRKMCLYCVTFYR